MKLENNAAGLQYLVDRQAIEDVLVRYCRGVDRCDEDLLNGVYWPDATDDHIFKKVTGAEFADFALPVIRSRDITLHSVTNFLIRIDGNGARSECHFHAYERLRKKDGTSNDILMHGRYLDRLEKRDGEWRIADRRCVLDYWRVYSDSCDWERGLFGTKFETGKRGDEDHSAALFGDRLKGG